MALNLCTKHYKHIHNRKECTCGTQSSKLNTCTITMICGVTLRSAPHRESSNCETIADSCTLNQASVVAHNGHVTTTSCNNELQQWDRGCLLPVCTRNCWTCTTDIEHRVNGLQLRNHNDLEKSLCVTTGMSTTFTCNDGHVNNRTKKMHSLTLCVPVAA